MTTRTLHREVGRALRVLAVLVVAHTARPACAEDWGAYAIVPASAPAFVLEAVGSGTDRGDRGLDRQARGDAQPEVGHHSQGEQPLFDQALVQLDPRPGGGEGRREEWHAHRARNRQGATVAGVDPQEERERLVLPRPQACPGKRARSFRRQAGPGRQDRPLDEQSGRSTSAMAHQAARRLAYPGIAAQTSRPQHLCPARDQTRSRAQGRRSRTSRSRAARSFRGPCGK